MVQTPLPGKQFTDIQLQMPQGLSGLYEKAATLNVTWETSIECTSTGVRHGLLPTSTSQAASDVSDIPRPISGTHAEASSFQTDGEVEGYSSYNWSGYQISNVGQYVQVGWTVPTVTKAMPPYSSSGYFSSTWSGIGGGFGASQTAPLIQAGTEHDYSAGNVASYFFWYEIVNGPTDTGSEQKISSPVARPGDDVAGGAIWTPSTTPMIAPGYATLGICNFTLNKCVNIRVNQTPEPGNTVEWITEAPSENGGVLPLANFTSVNYINACWTSNWVPGGSNTCSTITQGTSEMSIQLYENVLGARQLLASPGAIMSGTNFTDNYFAPQRNN